MNRRDNQPDNPARKRERFAPWKDPAARPLVRFDAVSKHFAGVTAVDGVSLDIYQGEFFALLGPSGCGKTTLLRMLAGFEVPDTGRVLLEPERDISCDGQMREQRVALEHHVDRPAMRRHAG